MNGDAIDIQSATKSDDLDIPPKRGRSEIDFPYNDLTDGISVASSLNEFAGSQSCEISELAAHMGMAAAGGGFRLKVAAARIFGLVQNEQRGRLQITDLGSKILSAEHEVNAKVEAFLKVELYNKLYESRKGHPLPQDAVLEREIANLGVPPKQKAKARQVFERSANQAGFIQQGSGRLVRPPMKGGADNTTGGNGHKQDNDKGGGGGGSGSGESRSVTLRSGGTLTISASTGFLSLSSADRKFVFGLIDSLEAYEKGNSQDDDDAL